MFEKRAVTKALLWMVPITGAIFYLLPISVQMKFFFEVLIGMPPALVFLLELDEMIKAVLLFSKNRRIYYNFGGKGVKESEITRFKTAYEKAGKRQSRK